MPSMVTSVSMSSISISSLLLNPFFISILNSTLEPGSASLLMIELFLKFLLVFPSTLTSKSDILSLAPSVTAKVKDWASEAIPSDTLTVTL